MPTSRLLDMKLRCVFEFTEAEQQRLQSPQANDQGNLSTVSTGSSASLNTTRTLEQEVKPAPAPVQAPKPVNIPTQPAPVKSISPNVSVTNTLSSSNTPVNATTNKINDIDLLAKDFESTIVNSTVKAPAVTLSRMNADKNDISSNEMKLLKIENENLKKEIGRLKVSSNKLKK